MYRSLEEICKEAAATGCSFWELIQKDDCRERQIAQEESFVQLQRMYQAMKRGGSGLRRNPAFPQRTGGHGRRQAGALCGAGRADLRRFSWARDGKGGQNGRV